MRTIKFRAWVKNKEVEMGNEMIDIEEIEWDIGNTMLTRVICHPYEFDVKDVELMQFTGLKDKNGKEIFEGDIVQVKIMKSDGCSRNWKDWLKFKGEVVFSNTGFAITDKTNVIWQFAGGGLLWVVTDIEVIGNIYENPELLEEEK